MAETSFIGIDLAWQGGKKSSGFAVLNGDRKSCRLAGLAVVPSDKVLACVRRSIAGPSVVAIDAPLIIRNKEGQRPCEKLVGKEYGARHAACHTSNLSLFPHAASVHLASELQSLGFRHAPEVTDRCDARVMLEVYPHPAMLELFSLPRIIKYKKGPVDARRRGQKELQSQISKLKTFSPPLELTPDLCKFLNTDLNALRGTNLKDNEDNLDALVCAYIAYHYWFWGMEGIRVFGDVNFGYIVVPVRRSTLSLN